MQKAQDEYEEDSFTPSIGAEVIQQMLTELDLPEIKKSLQEDLFNTSSEVKKNNIVKILKLVETFLESENEPEWMIMSLVTQQPLGRWVSVIPPEITPILQLLILTNFIEGLLKNKRLKRLLELTAPDIIIRNEKKGCYKNRSMHYLIMVVVVNTNKRPFVKNTNKRPFKSLSDMLKDKKVVFVRICLVNEWIILVVL